MKLKYRYYEVRVMTELRVEKIYAFAHSIANAQLLASEHCQDLGRKKMVCIGGATIKVSQDEVIKASKSNDYVLVIGSNAHLDKVSYQLLLPLL